jgi:Fur family ferric uptake transcriptional regulator
MPDLQSVVGRLEAMGHRITPTRVAVIATALAQSGHFSIDDINRQARNVGRATIFRTMRLLTELEIICRVLMEDGSLRYIVSRRGHHHHHLVCVSCGTVHDLADCAVGDMVRDLAATTGYEIDGHWLEFYGRCADCRKPAAAKP